MFGCSSHISIPPATPRTILVFEDFNVLDHLEHGLSYQKHLSQCNRHNLCLRADDLDLDVLCSSLQEELQELSQPERIKRVHPFWESLSHEERLEMMTFSIKEVKAYAALAARQIEREADGNTAYAQGTSFLQHPCA